MKIATDSLDISGLGARLKQLRKRQHLTQKQLAEPRYTHAYVSTIESDRRQPSPQAMSYFAGKLRVSVEELRTGRPPDLVAQLEALLVAARRMISTGQLKEADSSYQHVARDAKRFGLSGIQIRAEVGRALCAERQGTLQEAIRHAEAAEHLARGESGSSMAEAISVKARCLHLHGDTRHAAFLLERNLYELERQGLRDPIALMRLHASLVAVYFELGLYKKAADSAATALELAPQVNDPEHVANMHINVARVLLSQGKPEEAKDSLRRAEDLYRSIELRAETGRAHLARGYILSREEDFDRATFELLRAASIFSKCSSRIDEARASNELARIHRIRGATEEAVACLKHSLKLLQGSQHGTVKALTYRELGLCLIDRDPKAAEKHLRKAIDLFRGADDSIDMAVTYRLLGDVLRSQGEREAGWEAYREGLLLLEQAALTS